MNRRSARGRGGGFYAAINEVHKILAVRDFFEFWRSTDQATFQYGTACTLLRTRVFTDDRWMTKMSVCTFDNLLPVKIATTFRVVYGLVGWRTIHTGCRFDVDTQACGWCRGNLRAPREEVYAAVEAQMTRCSFSLSPLHISLRPGTSSLSLVHGL